MDLGILSDHVSWLIFLNRLLAYAREDLPSYTGEEVNEIIVEGLMAELGKHFSGELAELLVHPNLELREATRRVLEARLGGQDKGEICEYFTTQSTCFSGGDL